MGRQLVQSLCAFEIYVSFGPVPSRRLKGMPAVKERKRNASENVSIRKLFTIKAELYKHVCLILYLQVYHRNRFLSSRPLNIGRSGNGNPALFWTRTIQSFVILVVCLRRSKTTRSSETLIMPYGVKHHDGFHYANLKVTEGDIELNGNEKFETSMALDSVISLSEISHGQNFGLFLFVYLFSFHLNQSLSTSTVSLDHGMMNALDILPSLGAVRMKIEHQTPG